jgi:hypothetical protein
LMEFWTSFELEQAGVPSDGSIAWLLIKKPPQGQKRWVWRFRALHVYQTYTQPPALILGFAGCNRGELHRGVALLQKALRVGSKSIF